MRIISGKYKGRRLFTATDHIRPTTDRIKEYIFSVLRDFLENATVMDLFAGSGSLGLEALSRGASKVTFVEKSFQSIQVLRKNLERIDSPENVKIIKSDVLTFLKQNQNPVRFIFADPPFRWDRLNELIELVFQPHNLEPEGIFILEWEKSHRISWNHPLIEVIQEKKFDRSVITFAGWRKY